MNISWLLSFVSLFVDLFWFFGFVSVEFWLCAALCVFCFADTFWWPHWLVGVPLPVFRCVPLWCVSGFGGCCLALSVFSTSGHSDNVTTATDCVRLLAPFFIWRHNMMLLAACGLFGRNFIGGINRLHLLICFVISGRLSPRGQLLCVHSSSK